MRSLRARLWLIWTLTLLTSLGVAVLLGRLYESSATAQVERAEAVVANACSIITERFGYFIAGWDGRGADQPSFGQDLVTVVRVALAPVIGVEGGIWSASRGTLAYSFPSYEGTGPKTDVPEAETPTIRSLNAEALASGQDRLRRVVSGTQTLLIAACPVGGPVAGLTAWTMTRVQWNTSFDSLRIALGLLGGLVLLIAASVAWMTATWARHIGRLETALQTHDADARLLPTGERELDRLIAALNAAGERTAKAQAGAAELASQMAATEHLAGLGRMAAGIAHEIRNPMAAMRLRAENALAGDASRLRPALELSLHQIDRVDRLVGEMLAITQRRVPQTEIVDLPAFLDERVSAVAERAAARGMRLSCRCGVDRFTLDPELIGRAIDNLLLNALQHTPDGGQITVSVQHDGAGLRIEVADTGPGIEAALRHRLFEPFATSRPDGTGLGLAIARELVGSHGGTLLLANVAAGTVFVIELPGPTA